MDVMEAGEGDAAPRKRRRYTAEEELEIINFVRTSSFASAHARFGVSRTSVHEWLRREEYLRQCPRKSMRFRKAKSVAENGSALTPVDDASSCASECLRLTTSRVTTTSSLRSGRVDNPPLSSAFCALEAPHHKESFPTHHGRHVDGCGGARKLLVGFHGEDGGFAHIASRRFFQLEEASSEQSSSAFGQVGYSQAVQMLEALSAHEIDYAVLARDTLFSPLFRAALDRVVLLRFTIVAELTCDETNCLCGLPGVQLASADCVMSNWEVLARCEEYLLRLECENNRNFHRQVSWDSATACRIIREEQDMKTLVLCSDEAAQTNELIVVQARVPSKVSCTKYMVIGRRGASALFRDMESTSAVIKSPQRQSTILITSIGRAPLFGVIDTFTRLGIIIEHICVLTNGDDPIRSDQTCVVSYRSSNAVNEATLSHDLGKTSRQIIHLGQYCTFSVRETYEDLMHVRCV